MLKFYFTDFQDADLTNVHITFTNFYNPFSAATIYRIQLKVFSTKDCSGAFTSSVTLAPVSFWPKAILAKSVKLESSSNTLGDADPNVEMIVSVAAPNHIISKTGRGSI